MSDPIIIDGGPDAWVNGETGKTRENYGDTNAVHVKSDTRYAYCRPPIPNILGRTVTSAYLYGHAGPSGLVEQDFTASLADKHWTQGRITWANKPGVVAGTARVGSILATDPGELTFIADVGTVLQAVADGTVEYHGWRITTTATDPGQRFTTVQSGEPAWELHLTLSEDPEQPENLRPDGGAINTDTPILAWDFVDIVDGDNSEQLAYQVQVDTPTAGAEPDEVTPDHDTGWLTSPEPQHNLAGTAYVPPAAPAGSTYWRVRVRDLDSNKSEWSGWADYTVDAHPALIVDAPTGDVGDPAVTVLAHLASGNLEQWFVRATGPDRSDIRWRSGPQTTSSIETRIPLRNDAGRRIFREGDGGTRGWIYIHARDDVDRAAAVGEERSASVWIPVTFGDSAAIAPTSLTVAQYAPGDPRLVWRFHITDVPESFTFQCDGDTFAQVGADDLTPEGGWYEWIDSGQVPPGRPRNLSVRAINDAGRSVAATVWAHVHHVDGLWLIPETTGAPIGLRGSDVSGFERSDRDATYTPVRGPEVTIIYDREGFRGSYDGSVDIDTPDLWGTIDRIEKLHRSRNRTSRVVWGTHSILARIKSPVPMVTPAYNRENLQHSVRFDFVQTGD